MKKALKFAIIFLILGLVMGVYYREATKWTNFYATNHRTTLAFVHVHLLTFGMIFGLAGVGHAVLAIGMIGLLCYLIKFEKIKN